jgi:hypothetical protein
MPPLAMNPAPRVSVLMPVRDGQSVIAKAIESVRSQTYGDLEILVVDDGSTDGTAEILAGLAARDGRIRVERQSPQGITSALRRGFELARGEFVARMDADDIALPDRLERQVDFLDEHPEVLAVGGACIVVDEDGSRDGVIRFPTSPRVVERSLMHLNCLVHPTVTMRREAVVAAGGYRLDAAEDWDLWLRLSERGPLANLADPVLEYRRHAAQLSVLSAREYARDAAAALAAARERRAGRPDPLEGMSSATPELLERLGVSSRDIDLAAARSYARAIVRLELRGAQDQARELFVLASDAGGLQSRPLRAQVEIERARSQLVSHRYLPAARAALASLTTHPAVAVREVGRSATRAYVRRG